MQQRFLYVWLTHWKTDCQKTTPKTGTPTPDQPRDADSQQTATKPPQASKAQDTPHVITRSDHKGVLVCGLNAAAQKSGLQGGMRLSDARSILPDLQDSPEDSELCDGKFARLVRFMDRYSPWIAPDRDLHAHGLNGDAGMWLEITGGSHLFGGESAMIKQILRDMKAQGIAARAAIADTAGADDAKRLTGALIGVHTGPNGPVVALDRRDLWVEPPGEGEHQHDGVLGSRDGGAAGGVDYRYSSRGGGSDVDVVETDSAAADDPEIRAPG